jgi:tetratricopeptide (TPR) repeat protein
MFGRKGDSIFENPHTSDYVNRTGEFGNIDKLLSNLPEDYNELIKLGNNFMDNRHFPVAMECYRRALAIDSTNPNVICDLGACLHAMSDFKSAAEMFEKAIRMDSGHAIAYLNLGIVYRSMNNHEKAKLIWKKLMALYPDEVIADTAGKYIEMLDY